MIKTATPDDINANPAILPIDRVSPSVRAENSMPATGTPNDPNAVLVAGRARMTV